jgi:hypothetical protein
MSPIPTIVNLLSKVSGCRRSIRMPEWNAIAKPICARSMPGQACGD